jgi:hypothetical protein
MNHPVFSKDLLEIAKLLNIMLEKIIEHLMSMNSLLRLATRPRDGHPRNKVSIPGKGIELLCRLSQPVLESAQPPKQWEPEGFPYFLSGRNVEVNYLKLVRG